MKCFKSHFWYAKSQQNGILFLLLLIVVLQTIYWLVNFKSDELINTNSNEIFAFQKQIDSLKRIKIENKKTKLYPFNPNYITDFKGYQLGMSLEEIDRLLLYRKQNKWVNSVEDFKEVTKIHDSLLVKISTYFKFPDWVSKGNNTQTKIVALSKVEKNYAEKKFQNKAISTTDINEATIKDFKTIKGIGEKLSKRIIKYRSKLQGFSFTSQLYEVWGLDKKIANTALQIFKIVKRPNIQKININTANFKEVLKKPYINYELCKRIFDYRDEVAELQDISELKKIENFPIEKYDRIVLYLEAK